MQDGKPVPYDTASLTGSSPSLCKGGDSCLCVCAAVLGEELHDVGAGAAEGIHGEANLGSVAFRDFFRLGLGQQLAKGVTVRFDPFFLSFVDLLGDSVQGIFRLV